MDDVVEQLGSLLCSSLYKGLVFDPFREFVDANVDPAKASWSWLEWPSYVQSPACKGPRSGYRL
jgi:hypothetical protein